MKEKHKKEDSGVYKAEINLKANGKALEGVTYLDMPGIDDKDK